MSIGTLQPQHSYSISDLFYYYLCDNFYCRNIGNKTYVPTTWTILFNLTDVDTSSNYTLRLALASANDAELQVMMNLELQT